MVKMKTWPKLVVPNWCKLTDGDCLSLRNGHLNGHYNSFISQGKFGRDFCKACAQYKKNVPHDSDHEVDVIMNQQLRNELLRLEYK